MRKILLLIIILISAVGLKAQNTSANAFIDSIQLAQFKAAADSSRKINDSTTILMKQNERITKDRIR